MRTSTVIAMLAGLVIPSMAQAGPSTLKVSLDKAVTMIVDGQRFDPDESLSYEVNGLGEGKHEISIRNFLGKEMANVLLDVPADSEVRCRYRRRNFECYETVALVVTPPPVTVVRAPEPEPLAIPAQGSTEVVETTTTTTTTTTGDDMDLAPAPGFGGSISVTGPDGENVSMGINMGGMGMDMNMDMDMDVAESTTTTTTTTTVTQESYGTAPVVVTPPPTRRPVEVYREPPPPPRPTNVSLVIRSTDGEWADVLVDGKVVAEFRNDDEIQVTITSGSHTIEVREYMDDNADPRAKIRTGAKDAIVIGIKEGQPIECYNHNGCSTSF